LLPNCFCLWFPSFCNINVVNMYYLYWHSGYFKKFFLSSCFVYFYTVSENLSIFDKFIYFILCKFLFECFVHNTCTDAINEFVHIS
jgi:hypothetical protein